MNSYIFGFYVEKGFRFRPLLTVIFDFILLEPVIECCELMRELFISPLRFSTDLII
jgi:hypothetical protein